MVDGSSSAPAREIACDESGSEGDRLVDGNTAVFSHAGVSLSVDAAAACIAEIREQVRSPAVEYKANHLLRGKHRRVLEWFLGCSGPVLGHAHVYVVDKEYLLLVRLGEFLSNGRGPPGLVPVDGARQLYESGSQLFGVERWRSFLVAANDVLRRRGVDLDPLPSAVGHAAARWSHGGEPVVIVHDRQNALTPERVARLQKRRDLADLRFVASHTDPRIQIADYIAGVARAIAEDALRGRGDPTLLGLLSPYVDPASVWGDQVSGSALELATSSGTTIS